MTLSRECEYALKGLATLAAEVDGRPLVLSEIASREELPQSFLSKIFHRLLKHGLVISHRGVQRGYTLAREARTISLRNIIEAIEGPDLFDRCVFAHRRCGGENPCLVHLAWRDIRPQVQATFKRTTLHDVVKARRNASGSGVVARPRRQRRL